MADRLPAHIVVSGLVRTVGAAGGFATVLAKGERDAGTIALVTTGPGVPAHWWERLPQTDGSRPYTAVRTQDPGDPREFDAMVARRKAQDPDLWIVELDIADAERFVPQDDWGD